MSGDVGDGPDPDRPPWGFDAEEAARLALRVQDLGFAAARSVVERFAEMFEQFRPDGRTDGPTDGRRGDPPRPARPPGVELRQDADAFRRLQSDAERALDAYLAVLQRLNDVSLGFLGAARPWGDAPPPTDGVLLPDAAPGGRSSARLWLHNTTTSAVSDLRIWTPGLASHAGAALAAGAVTFTPCEVRRLDPGESREILVVIAVPAGAECGLYHGQALVERLPDAAFAVKVRVLAAPTAGNGPPGDGPAGSGPEP